jgi:rSAM/selenodomain-associated transferase 1
VKGQLVILAKAPRLGRVKSRLAADIGAVRAWGFYRNALAQLVRRLRGDPRWNCRLWVDDGAARWPRGVSRHRQVSGDLGQRMAHVMRSAPQGPVVIIGADIPDIRPRHIAAAFRALGSRDVVFGPADDGGYWLVGFRRRPVTPAPFAPVRWSSGHALADTTSNLGNRFSVAFCDVLGDVDDGAAYHCWRARSGARTSRLNLISQEGAALTRRNCTA